MNYLCISKRGFTLIELLVVIAIIGILSSVVLASLGNARASARDAQRVEEMNSFRVALELYYNVQGAYPACSAPTQDISGWTTAMNCLNAALTGAGVLKNAINDPQFPAKSYTYDNWCNVPNSTNTGQYRMWGIAETPQHGLLYNWWTDYTVGVTTCIDPS